MSSVTVIGAGPAGSTAAIAACREGAEVRIYEKSIFPRHKVCGEFLSPEVSVVFEKLGIMQPFLDLNPFLIREANVRVGGMVKQWTLDEPAYGISRYTLDNFLLEYAKSLGAEMFREPAKPVDGRTVLATGRQRALTTGNRLFGFKAHFSGEVNDRIDLLFEGEMYLGISCVENGMTNVCGLASESLLRRYHFRPDELIEDFPRLEQRLRGLTRKMDWLVAGPLVFGGGFEGRSSDELYPAGDALGFVDPFTGSGMLGAIATGFLAGRAGAQGVPAREHLAACRKLLGKQYKFAALFRTMIRFGLAGAFARLAPGQMLFDLTRPGVSESIT
jgi:flavin-dependent dehydrogenase